MARFDHALQAVLRWLNLFIQRGGEDVMTEQFERGYDRKRLIKQLSVDEARRKYPYKDSEGILTIGVGWNLEANGLPEHIIDQLLDIAIVRAEQDVHALYSDWRRLNSTRQEVLLNMALNLGRKKFRLFKKMWAAIQDGNFKLASEEMLDSKWAGQVGVRAKRLAKRMANARDHV